MYKVNILNIPNYYCSYYLLGLGRIGELKYTPSKEFAHLNGKPFLVIEVNGKVIVIENDDPIGVDKQSYNLADLYFATNKLINKEDYNWPKIRPLFPHYSIGIPGQYIRIFGFNGLLNSGLKGFVRQAYILNKRPDYQNIPFCKKDGNYVFFAGNIWEKEPSANQVRAAYVLACQNHPLIQFEGGMIPRSDGNLCGLPPEVLNRNYLPKEFAEKSAQSVLGFINPAVLDAVSWRLAEYLNYGSFIMSLPFKIQMPIEPIHGKEIHYLEDTSEFSEIITFAMTHPEYRNKLSRGAKDYFQNYCLPEKQAQMILESI